MGWWYYLLAIILYLISASFLVSEMRRSSKGIKSIAGLFFVIAGVGIFFSKGFVTGWIGIGVAVIVIPAFVIISWKKSLKKYQGSEKLPD